MKMLILMAYLFCTLFIRVDKVDKPKEEGSPMLKKLGLDTWHAQVAAATGLAIPLLINEVICIEIEMLLLPPFFYYCSQVYTHVMPGIYASVNESIEEQKAEYENMESAEYSGHFESLDTYKSYVSLEDDMKTLYATVDELSAQQSEALISKAKFDFRDSMAKKLDSLVALEDAAALNIKQRMLKDVKASVEATLSTDKKIKDDALKQAISILAGGSKATRGKDIVGEAFNGALKKYRDDYSKGDPSKDPIVVQLMADAKAIAANA
jgi:hypothetical protein